MLYWQTFLVPVNLIPNFVLRQILPHQQKPSSPKKYRTGKAIFPHCIKDQLFSCWEAKSVTSCWTEDHWVIESWSNWLLCDCRLRYNKSITLLVIQDVVRSFPLLFENRSSKYPDFEALCFVCPDTILVCNPLSYKTSAAWRIANPRIPRRDYKSRKAKCKQRGANKLVNLVTVTCGKTINWQPVSSLPCIHYEKY